MAITSVSSPADWHPAFNPVVYTFSSYRYTGVEGPKTATVHADNGSGFLRVTIAAHGWVVGDRIDGAGFTDAFLNVAATITAKTASTFDLDIVWDAGFAADLGGTWTRNDQSFQMKCDVYIGAVKVASKYADPNAADQFVFSIENILQAYLTGDIIALGTFQLVTSNVKSGFEYYIILTEQNEDVNGLIVDFDTLTLDRITGNLIHCWNVAMQDVADLETTYWMDTDGTGDFLTNRPLRSIAHTDEYLQLSFFTSADPIYAVVEKWTGGSGVSYRTPVVTLSMTGTGFRAVLAITPSQLGGDRIVVKIKNAADAQLGPSIEILMDARHTSQETTLMWRNNLGGYDSYTFVKRSKSARVERKTRMNISQVEQVHWIEGREEWDLEGRTELPDAIAWLFDLYASPEVYLVDGTTLREVIVTSMNNILEQDDFMQPKVSIKKAPRKNN
jgi:hypothetical protein